MSRDPLCNVFPLPGCEDDNPRGSSAGPASPSVSVGPSLGPSRSLPISSTSSFIPNSRSSEASSSASQSETSASARSSAGRGSTSTSFVISTRSSASPRSSGTSRAGSLADSSDSSSTGSSLSVGAIAGIAVGGIAVAVLLAWLLAVLCRKRKRRTEDEAIQNWESFNVQQADRAETPILGNQSDFTVNSFASPDRDFAVAPMSQVSHSYSYPSANLAQFAPPPPPVAASAGFKGPMDRVAPPPVPVSISPPRTIPYQPHARKKSEEEYGFVNGML